MLKLLIVDDEEAIRNGLCGLVDWDELGMRVAGCASNGSDALEMIKANRPDIMICDIRMPVMDGLTLLKRLVEEKIGIHTIILSGYNDFSYVKEALRYHVENYLLKPVDKDELVSTLLGIAEKSEDGRKSPDHPNGSDSLRSNVLNRLISRKISERELEDRLQFLQIKPLRPPYRAAVLRLIGLISEQAEKAACLVQEAIQNELDLRNAGLCFMTPAGILSIVLSAASTGQAPARALLEDCLGIAIRTTGKDTLVTAGRTVETVEDVARSHEDATVLQDYIHLTVRNRTLLYDDALSKPVSAARGWDLDPFELIIRDRRKDEAFAFVDRICSDCAAASANINQVKSIFIELAAACFRVARRLKLDVEPLLAQHAAFDQVLSGEAGISLPDWLKSLVDTLIDNIGNAHRKVGSQADTILDYIDRNFAKELSLGILADRFGLTPAYIGTLIKSETGEIFSTHLNRIRVEKAKDQLLTTSSSASEISRQVGYWDVNYFYKVFKRITGKYPAEYRKHS